jgi:hypothetical protein
MHDTDSGLSLKFYIQRIIELFPRFAETQYFVKLRVFISASLAKAHTEWL